MRRRREEEGGGGARACVRVHERQTRCDRKVQGARTPRPAHIERAMIGTSSDARAIGVEPTAFKKIDSKRMGGI